MRGREQRNGLKITTKKEEMMRFFLAILLVCVACTLLVQSTAVPVQNCGQTFQTQLDQLQNTILSLAVAFYDCCQVYV